MYIVEWCNDDDDDDDDEDDDMMTIIMVVVVVVNMVWVLFDMVIMTVVAINCGDVMMVILISNDWWQNMGHSLRVETIQVTSMATTVKRN